MKRSLSGPSQKDKITEAVLVLIRRNQGINFDDLHSLLDEKFPGVKRIYLRDIIGVLFRNSKIWSEDKKFYI